MIKLREHIPDELLAALNAPRPGPVLVAGIGSANEADGVGWLIADLVADLNLPGITVRRALVPLDLLDWIGDYAQIHVVDALQSDHSEGVVRHWNWPQCAGISDRCTSTHGFDLISVLHLATVLDIAKSPIVIWGIEAPKGWMERRLVDLDQA